MRRAGAIVALAAVATGCAFHSSTVVLLPEPDGRATAVSVSDSRGEVVLDRPFAAVRGSPFGAQPYVASPEEVQSTFGATLAALPRGEAAYIVHFDEGKDRLSDDSRAVLDQAFAEIASRPVPDVLVVGHTDRVGSDAVNDALARQRADSVRTELVRRGLPPESVQASSRGSRDPIVPTAAGVAEPRNRRVEIIVR
ncbi:Outer membrane protein P5 [Burkholderiales bacterium]|nr:Outer membrane protein P5 [Burkholderiales bacterium]